ncbi:MAG: GNAT family N-acetyltransferase [Proteobacteria bacterium]|nr:GNAT family N-acetyltransferase [Pseudomonadota bacterium]
MDADREFAGDCGARPDLPDWAQALVEDLSLRDGTPVTLRPIRPQDLPRHTRFVRGLSPHTGYMRLLSPRMPQPDELQRMTETDYPHALALVAIACVDGVQTEVGVARYAPSVDARAAARGSAEFAIVLADAWQSRGLARVLLSRLVEAARAAGVRELSDVTLHENAPMIGLARALGFTVQRDPHDARLTRLRKALAE